jgi:hypothetical protein
MRADVSASMVRAVSKLALAFLLLLVPFAQRADAAGDDEVRTVINKHGEQLRRCYKRGQRAAPELGRKLVVRFRVTSGRVQRVTMVAERSTLHDTSVEGCIAKVFRSMKFRKVVDGDWHESPLVFPAT